MNSRSFIQLSETLPVELTETHIYILILTSKINSLEPQAL